MKNLYRISTKNSSKIGFIAETDCYHIFSDGENPNDLLDNLAFNVHIYIISKGKEQISDFVLCSNGNVKKLHKDNINDKFVENWEKIILTTDPELIKDGVQEIDNDFLEWLVKNPKCEEVEINFETLYLNKRGWQPFPDEHIDVHEKKRFYKTINLKENVKKSYIEERRNHQELIPKKSQTVIGIIGENYLYCANAKYLIMQDDLDYIRIQGLKIFGAKREAYLTNCTINGEIVIKAKLKSVWNEES